MEASGGVYEIRIKGTIGVEWEEWFDNMEIKPQPSGETIIRGGIRDQAELHAVLDRLSDLNLTLISVNRIDISGKNHLYYPDSKESNMKTTVVSYSLTGNNEAFASALAAGLSAEHLRVTEPKSRKMGTIVLDVLLGRTPKISPLGKEGINSDLVIFAGPVWMGKVASPFRAVFRKLKGSLRRYTFVSISGGADGPNPKLEQELTERTGVTPAAVIDLHIADLLPADPKPGRKDTMKYRLNGVEVEELSRKALKVLRESAFSEGE